jgi:hypothetical protein
MIIGQTIMVVGNSLTTTTSKVYTPWVPSWGDAAIFPFEIIAIGGGAALLSFTAQVFTKSTEDPDPGTANGTLNSQTTPGTYSITDASGLRELVRIEFKLTVRVGVQTAFAHFRPLAASWKTN